MNDNQVKKLIDKDKIHKLIHKLFLGDRLNNNQYKVVYDYVKEKGVTLNRSGLTCRSVFDEDITGFHQNWKKPRFLVGITQAYSLMTPVNLCGIICGLLVYGLKKLINWKI